VEASEATASRFIGAIKADFDLLLTFPLSGPSRERLAPNLRVKLHGDYAAYYTPTPREVIIVRVLHGARDATAIADRGGFSE
jgi:toxin ParE1/3/4